jgi:hypothetical protein
VSKHASAFVSFDRALAKTAKRASAMPTVIEP